MKENNMRIWKCLVIEDEESCIAYLKDKIEIIGFYELTVCRSPAEAIKALNEHTFDLIFADIILGAYNGLNILRAYPSVPPIIITSANPEYAIETYDISGVIDFLQKPYSTTRFLRAINKALSIHITPKAFITKDEILLKTGKKVTKFAINDILYIQAYGIYSKVHSTTSIEVVNDMVGNLEKLLPSTVIKRVHKSYLINITKVDSYDHGHFYINKHKIPIGRHYKSELFPYLNILNNLDT